jgi:polyisoprenoid-binding protein YceI
LEFRLDQLELDRPDDRARLGAAYGATLSAADIDSTRAHMLGEENLQADQFPFVRIHSLQIVGEPPKFAAEVRIELHGQQRPMWIAIEAAGLPEHLRVSGSFVLRQSDFGVRPYSALSGLLAIEDALAVEFNLVGE